LVANLLAHDARFTRDAVGDWALTSWNRDDPLLAAASYCILALETTGLLSGLRREPGRVAAIAAEFVQDGRVVGQYRARNAAQALLPPGAARAAGAAGHGGSAEMILPAEEVLRGFHARVGDAVVVGPRAAADLALLNHEAARYGLPGFDNLALDVQAAAVPRPGRGGLNAGRAAAPAPAASEAVAAALRALLERLDERGVRTISHLRQWLAASSLPTTSPATTAPPIRSMRPAGARVAPPTGTLVPLWSLASLPERPGVYLLKDGQGRVLYVGAAASLRAAVERQVTGAMPVLQPDDRLLARAVGVDHTVADCELDAMLLAAQRIGTLRPPYNVAENQRRYPLVRIGTGAFARVGEAGEVVDDGALYFGPYATAQAARHTAQVLRRVFQLRARRHHRMPHTTRITAHQYSVLIEYAQSYATAGREATIQALRDRLQVLTETGQSSSWEFNALTACLARLLRVRREYRPLPGGLAGGALVLAYPAADGRGALFFVHDGRLTGRARVMAAQASPAALEELIATHLRASASDYGPAEGLPPLSLEQTNFLLRWIHQHSGQPELIPAGAGRQPHEIAAAAAQAWDSLALQS
jgi:hypothetical protein